MTTPLSETAFRDAVGSLVDTARQLAAATRTLDTVRALSKAHPCERWASGHSCRTDERDEDRAYWCLPCELAAAVNPALTPKGPKP